MADNDCITEKLCKSRMETLETRLNGMEKATAVQYDGRIKVATVVSILALIISFVAVIIKLWK